MTREPQQAGPSDVQLMSQLAAGDVDAFEILVRRHQYRAQSLAYRLSSDRQVAEDIAQEAFLRVYRGARRYEPKAAFSTWLHTIIVNLYLDWLKGRRPAARLVVDLAVTNGHEPSDKLLGKERDEAVRRELAHLPERQRVALVLHCYEGLGHGEIAAVTGWSQSAVESLLVRAYRNLRDKLRSWGSFR